MQLHDTVRDAIARNLRASDPQRYLTYRRACWSRLNRDLSTAPSSELWRYTADLLYLLENPVCREAFFPSGAQRYTVEPACANDEAAILEITERHDRPAAARATSSWFKHCAKSFCVVRGPDGNVTEYYVLFDAAWTEALLDDPVMAQWARHLIAHPVAPDERVLFLRRWLSRNDGDLPCAVRASCWVDVKRTYMAHRPFLRRVYVTSRNVAPYSAAMTQLGFRAVPECAAEIAGEPYTTGMLDFGADSVDGWFAKLVAAELGIATSDLLDVGAREVVVGSRRAPLSPQEFDTFYYLMQRKGCVVDREDVLAEVWGADSEVASNVVDVVIRSLRKKLGARANAIETMSGVGYRFRER